MDSSNTKKMQSQKRILKLKWTMIFVAMISLVVLIVNARHQEATGVKPEDTIISASKKFVSTPFTTVTGFSVNGMEMNENQEATANLTTIFSKLSWDQEIRVKRVPEDAKLLIQTDQGTYQLYLWQQSDSIEVDGDLGRSFIRNNSDTQFAAIIQSVLAQQQGTRTFDEETTRWIRQSLLKGVKLDGIFDMVEPSFNIAIGIQKISFWLQEDGRILYSDSSGETVYAVENAEELQTLLRKAAEDDLQQFMQHILWKKGQVSMTRQYDATFTWNDMHYELWVNEKGTMTLIPANSKKHEWTALNKEESAKLAQYLRENFNLIIKSF